MGGSCEPFTFVVVATSSSRKNKCWITDDGTVVGQGSEIISNKIVSENDYIKEGYYRNKSLGAATIVIDKDLYNESYKLLVNESN